MEELNFPGWPAVSAEEADRVRQVLLSNRVNYWTGEEGQHFEKEFANFCESKYAIAVANGTLALDLALRSLGIGPGDQVIVTSRTFIASVSSIILVGAEPIFADVDPDSQNITSKSIAEAITPETRAIIAVHLAGWPCDMDAIMKLAKQHDLKVIEDCAQAHGARFRGRSVGSLADVGVWSFCQDKIMTTGGEGGMVTTNDEALWSAMWSYKDHGKSWSSVYERQHPPGFRWLHDSFGTNARLTEMQSAIGRIQLGKMPVWSETRRRNAEMVWTTARELPGLRVPEIPDEVQHGAYKCYVFVEPETLSKKWTRDRIIDRINGLGVPCMEGSCSEVYLEKAFDNTPWRPLERLAVARELGATSLMFPVHPTLSADHMNRICDALKQAMYAATV
ncbi:MAG: DegT/DnrJ/EryC1/StrS aminotransferase family protein [Gammaproteobacteria bacterium]